MSSDLRSNIPKVFAFKFFTWFLVIIPVIVPFFKSRGLSMGEIYTLQAIFSATILILEVPTGYLSDLWGRKKTLILGGVFGLAGGLILPLSENFLHLAVFEVLLGVASSLWSGTDAAILYDTIYSIEGKQTDQKILGGKVVLISSVSETIAAILGGLLALKSLEWAAWGSAIAYAFPLIVSLTFVEPPIHKMEEKTHWANFKMITDHLFKDDIFLRLTFLNLAAWGSATLVMVWSYQQIWDDFTVPLSAFGFLWAAYNLTIGLVGQRAHKIENFFGPQKTLWITGLLPIIGFLGFALVNHWIAIIFGFIFSVTRGLNWVILNDALNVRVPSKFRASANSLAQLTMRGIFCILGPMMGFIIDSKGMSSALLSMAAIYAVIFLAITVPLGKLLKKV